jgi:hypothetical protein
LERADPDCVIKMDSEHGLSHFVFSGVIHHSVPWWSQAEFLNLRFFFIGTTGVGFSRFWGGNSVILVQKSNATRRSPIPKMMR